MSSRKRQLIASQFVSIFQFVDVWKSTECFKSLHLWLYGPPLSIQKFNDFSLCFSIVWNFTMKSAMTIPFSLCTKAKQWRPRSVKTPGYLFVKVLGFDRQTPTHRSLCCSHCGDIPFVLYTCLQHCKWNCVDTHIVSMGDFAMLDGSRLTR